MMINFVKTSEIEAGIIGTALKKDNCDYKAHFSAFSNSNELIDLILKNRKDVYKTIKINEEVCGIYFLRGFQEGYEIPSFGIYIFEKYSGRGLAAKALEDAINVATNLGVDKVMLKVSKQNSKAYPLYLKHQFRFDRLCLNTGHDILIKELK